MRDESPKNEYESAVLSVLSHEFEFSNKSDTERAIKRTLLEKNLSKYDEARIAALRCFKDSIQREVSRGQKSKYFTHSHSGYADFDDFDCHRMAKDYSLQFPGIQSSTIASFVNSAIYLYYLR